MISQCHILYNTHLLYTFYHMNWNFNLKKNDLGSVWIGLILLKLKNYCWNYCSKIIFKCVNSAVGPIFNEKIDKKWNLWVCKQCTDALFTKNWSKVAATVHVPYMNSSHLWGENAWKKKKKKGKTQKQNADANPNITLVCGKMSTIFFEFYFLTYPLVPTWNYYYYLKKNKWE